MADRYLFSIADESRREQVVQLDVAVLQRARRARPSQAWPRRIRHSHPDTSLTAGAAVMAHSAKRAAQL